MSNIIILLLHFGPLCIVLSRAMRRDRIAYAEEQRTDYLRALVNWHLRPPTLRSYASLPIQVDLTPHHR